MTLRIAPQEGVAAQERAMGSGHLIPKYPLFLVAKAEAGAQHDVTF